MGQQALCFRVGWLGGWGETLLVIEEETEVKSLLRPSWYLSQESCLNGSAVKYTPLQQKKKQAERYFRAPEIAISSKNDFLFDGS